LGNMIVFGNDEMPEITFFGNSSVFGKVDPVTKVKLILSFTIEKRCIIVKVGGTTGET
jgi:hypothetical protein